MTPLTGESTTLLAAARRVIEESGNRSCRPDEPPSRHVNAQAFDALLRAVAARDEADQPPRCQWVGCDRAPLVGTRACPYHHGAAKR